LYAKRFYVRKNLGKRQATGIQEEARPAKKFERFCLSGGHDLGSCA
jgi:hypothetical protein